MISVQEYQRLLEEVPRLKNELAREEGAKEQMTKSLFEEFGISTLEELESLEKELTKEVEALESEIANDYKAYLKAYEKTK